MQLVDPGNISVKLGLQDHNFVEQVGIFCLSYLLELLPVPVLAAFLQHSLVFVVLLGLSRLCLSTAQLLLKFGIFGGQLINDTLVALSVSIHLL